MQIEAFSVYIFSDQIQNLRRLCKYLPINEISTLNCFVVTVGNDFRLLEAILGLVNISHLKEHK